MADTLVVGSTNSVTLTGLKNVDTGAFPVDATVEITALLDESNAVVDGTANLPMAYVAGTVGIRSKYLGAIPHTVVLVAGVTYTRRVTATSGTNVRRFDTQITATA